MSAKRKQGVRPGSFWTLFNRPGGWVFFFGALALVAGMLALQREHVKRYREKPWIETFVLPQPEYVKLLSVGYDAWLSDFFFLRAIQGFGGAYWRPAGATRDYAPVFNYFDVISALDPHFIAAYKFGNLVMGDEGGHQELALEYLKRGQWNNWRTFAPWYEAAYIKVYQLKQPDNEAVLDVRMAAKAHDAPEWVNRLEGYVREKEGQYSLGLLHWLQAYAEAIDNGDDIVAGIAERRILVDASTWRWSILQNAVQEFAEKEGRDPESLEEVADRGYLPPVKVIDPKLVIDGVKQQRDAGQPVLPVVELIFDSALVEEGGVFENLQEDSPYVLLCTPYYDVPQVATEAQRRATTEDILGRYRELIAKTKEDTGKYPDAIEGLVIPGLDVAAPDPYCNGWDYDSQTGMLRSGGNPSL